MIVGVPAEVKTAENRVALTPDGVRELTAHGHRVLIERGAGEGSSISDDDYAAVGGELVERGRGLGRGAGVKVKEPQPEEYGRLREDLVLFTYLHLAAYPEVAKALLAAGTTGLAYETVQLRRRRPAPAGPDERGGRPHGDPGRGPLPGADTTAAGACCSAAPPASGRPGSWSSAPATSGWNAAWIAQGMEAEVILLDKNLDRLRWVDQIHKGRIMTLASNRGAVERAVVEADLVIGAVLVAGGRAPTVVTEDMVRDMKPGAVIVDVAVDQGGCIETTHETTHADPVYELHGVIHYAVGNMPGAVPHTSTYALTNATLPYVVELAEGGLGRRPGRLGPAGGLTTVGGQVTNEAVAEALGLELTDPLTVFD